MKFSLIYILDFGKLEWQSVCLAASIRAFVRDRNMEVIAYCPAEKLDRLEKVTIDAHKKFGIEIRPLDTQSGFSPAYPHGNKILACAAPRETDFCIFMDTDMIFLRHTVLSDILHEGGFSAVRETNARWPQKPEQWDLVYSHLEPSVTRGLSVFSNRVVAPSYFNAGFVVFDDRPIVNCANKRFGELWRDLAYLVDMDDTVEEKRPFLDQITLPAAAGASGFDIRELPIAYNTQIRFEEATGDDIRVLHYHSNMFGHLLKESAHFGVLNQLLNYFGIASGFVDLVNNYKAYLAHPGLANVLRFNTPAGTTYGHILLRTDHGHVVGLYKQGYDLNEQGACEENFIGYGLVDVPGGLYEKSLRIVGNTPIAREELMRVAFQVSESDEGSSTLVDWVWNGRNKVRASNFQGSWKNLPDRMVETPQELVERCFKATS